MSSYAWLVLGGVLQVFGFGRRIVPLAAWLAPIFLLHFARNVQQPSDLLWLWLALGLAFALGNRGVIPLPRAASLAVVAGIAGVMTLPYCADRFVAPQLAGIAATLVFPVAWTAVEFLGTRLSPYGTWGALAYTQHGNLPLMQLAAVTGIWGIGFLIAWCAALVAWAWEQDFAWGAIGGGVLVYVALWVLAMLAGGARLAFARETGTVRIAGVGWPRGVIEPPEFMRVIAADCTASERERIREKFRRVQDSFFERSRREVQAGARIVVWPEASLMLLKDDEPGFLERAQRFVRDGDAFLLAGMAVLEPGAPRPVENKALLFVPGGTAALSYVKTSAVPGFEARHNVRGKGPIPRVDTLYGRVAPAICFDLDFPWLIRGVGRAGADLLLVPASDWREITRLHQLMAEFRAIENGVSLFRIARWGGSGAVDAYGRRLACMDDFAAPDNVMVAQVPVAGVRTVYARFGDWFGWGCAGALLAAIAWRIVAA